jgi:hypothetical protein
VTDINVYVIDARKICWPNPDATCLHGGCGYCDSDGRWKTLAQIERYARKAGVLPHRGRGEQDALAAFRYGLNNEFFRRPSLRTSRERLEEWVETVGVLALKKMADGMPGGTHARKRADVAAWLLRYRRDTLEESYLATARGKHLVR